jgi:glutathione S-transferase
MGALKLYNFDLDENCYRVRLALGLMAIEAEYIAVDMIPGFEHLKPPLIELNPRGDIPILVDDEVVVAGPVACLLYLARRGGGDAWAASRVPEAYAEYASWLEFAAAELPAARAARNVSLFGLPGDLDALRAKGRWALRLMEDHMTTRFLGGGSWFAGERASVVDIALMPAFALSRDWGVGHESYPALRRWLRAFRALPGFRSMPGVPDYF